MARDDLHFRLRIPEDLKRRIEDAASENHRSMTAEIVARLEASFDTPVTGKALYVLLDANGFPTSWPEIYTHLNQIAEAGDFSPDLVQARIFNGEVVSSSKREGEWFNLIEHYRSLRGLPPLFPEEDE